METHPFLFKCSHLPSKIIAVVTQPASSCCKSASQAGEPRQPTSHQDSRYDEDPFRIGVTKYCKLQRQSIDFVDITKPCCGVQVPIIWRNYGRKCNATGWYHRIVLSSGGTYLINCDKECVEFDIMRTCCWTKVSPRVVNFYKKYAVFKNGMTRTRAAQVSPSLESAWDGWYYKD